MTTFFNGFEKVAIGSALYSIARKAAKPGLLAAAGLGIGAGGFAVGKGQGKEEQLGADREVFKQYLGADYQRDVQNLNAATEQGFIQGYQYAAKKQPALSTFEKNLKKDK